MAQTGLTPVEHDRMALGEKIDPKLVPGLAIGIAWGAGTNTSIDREITFIVENRSPKPLKWIKARLTVSYPGMKPISRVITKYVQSDAFPNANLVHPGEWSAPITDSVNVRHDYWVRGLSGNVEVLEARAWEPTLNPKDVKSWVAYMIRNDLAAVQKAVEENPEVVELKSSEDVNVLHHIAVMGNVPLAKYFIGKGINPDAQDNKGRNAAFYAARTSGQVFKLMVENGASTTRNGAGEHPILFAAGSYRDNAPIDAVIAAGVEQVDLDKAFLYAIERTNIDYAKLLLKKGANLKSFNAEGAGPIGVALVAGGTEYATKVENELGKFKEIAPNGTTLLHLAAKKGHYNWALWVMKRGYDPNAKDDNGQTAFDLANQIGHQGDRRLMLAVLEGQKFE